MAATPTYHDALSLDIHTLSLLLQRNSSQHHRCIYFRRLSMVLSALRRLPSFQEATDRMVQWKGLVQLLIDECDEDGSNNATSEKLRKRRAKEERWTLDQDDGESSDSDAEDMKEQLHQMAQIIEQLKALTTQSLPQLKSRIIHATSPVIHELSRGYFVPFLTVALACLGRIHAVLLRMGRELTTVLRETVPRLRNLCVKQNNVRGDGGIMIWKLLKDLVMPTFQVKDAKNSTSQEWNDLMTQFVEVSSDDLTKQMNEFVKEKRWEDAMFRFGLGKRVHLVGKGGTSTADDTDTDGLSPSASNNKIETQPLAEEDNTNDDTHNDMGEIVNDVHPANDSTTNKLSGDLADENMMRVMQSQKVKRQLTKSGPESSVSKKKKRKRKKKTSVDVAASNDNGQSLPKQKDVMEREPPILDHTKPSEEDLHSKKSKQSINDDNVSTASMELSTIGKGEMSDVVKQKKSKKKSSKKSKKQKRKSSVIDDIFG